MLMAVGRGVIDMKHMRVISKTPAMAVGDVPPSILLAFIINILQAVAALFLFKEATGQ
jgi:hypothetical protein